MRWNLFSKLWRGPPAQNVTRSRRSPRRVPVLEALEDRITPSAVVWTNLEDYTPGATALISGSGFQRGETVELQVLHTDGTPNTGGGHEPWYFTDGGAADLDGKVDGNIQTTWYVNPDDSLGSTFVVTATGLSSGKQASATFTDAQERYLHFGNRNNQWILGALQASNSNYEEGEVIPHYWITSGLTVGQTYAFNIFYDFHRPATNVGGFSRLAQYDTDVTPQPVTPGTTPTSDPPISNQPLEGGGFIFTVGANVTVVSGPQPAAIQRFVSVTFTATATTAEFYWGLDLAIPGEVANGSGGASEWPGASIGTEVSNTPTVPGAIMLGGGGSLAINPDSIIQVSDLAITKTDGSATYTPGGSVTYTITVTNAGPSNVVGASVADIIPAILSNVSWTSTVTGNALVTQGATGSGNNLAATVNIGAGAGNSVVFTVTGTANPSATGNLVNTATVTAPTGVTDTNTTNNSATDTDTANRVSDLAVTKTVNNSTPDVGDTITFTVTLTNNGPGTANNIVLADLLPAGLSFVSAAPAQGTYNSVSGVWNVGTLNNGAGATLLLSARVDTNESRINTASVQVSSSNDPNPANDTASATVTPQQADLAVTKTVSNATPNVGDQITFTVTLTNAGPNAATGVTLEDLLPAGLTFVSATPSQGTYTPATGLWDVGTVASGLPQTLTINATVVSPNSRTNTAAIIGADQFDPNTANNTASATETPQRADLAVAKAVSDGTPNVGEQITFTVTLTNNGPNTATGVQVTDLLPAGVTFVSATPSRGTYTPSSGLWNVGTVAPGTPQTLAIVVTVVSTAAQTNTVAITESDQFDPNPGNNTGSATETPQQADLAITKSVSNPTPNVGDTITFTLSAANAGPDAATNVTVTDLLPAGVTFVSATASQGTYNNVAGVWTIGTVAPSATQTLTITVTVNSSAGIVNTATIEGDQFDPNTANNTDNTSADPQAADLAIIKSVSDPKPNPGDTISYTITAANTGPNTATGVTVNDMLPGGVTFVSSSASQGTYNNVTGIWTVGTLASPASETLTIIVTVDQPGQVVNTATIDGDQFDPNLDNNSAETSHKTKDADLAVVKSVSDATPNVGDQITFTVVLVSSGPDTATNVQVTDLLPSGVSFVTANPNQGTYTPATGLWDVGTVEPGTPLTLEIVATVLSSAAQTNTATISASDQFDPNTGNNSATATETPQRADLALTKTVSDATPNVGDVITFTVTVTNQGPDTATNVQVTDLLPPGLTPVLIRARRGSFAVQVWDVGTLAPGASGTLTIIARVDSPDARTNTASITIVDQFDPNTANNTASATETPQQADLALAKTVSDSTPNVGETITFLVTLTNSGPNPASNVTVNDLLPAGLAFVSAAPSQGAYDSDLGVWIVGTVNPGSPLTLIIAAAVVSPDAETNTATVGSADQFDPDTANNTASATETPQLADLALTKTVSNPRPNVGDTITFTINLTNTGPDAATNVQVIDLLPVGLMFVSATPSQGSYNSTSGVWTVGTVTLGAPQTLTIRATVVNPDPKTNTATVTDTDQFDPDPADNTASATETPQQADLSLTKIVSNPNPNVGDLITFTVTLSNSGPDPATTVAVSDLLPAGLTFVSAAPSQGTYNDATGVWVVGTVGTAAPASLTITAQVDSPNAQTNTATIIGADQFDPDPADNAASAGETPQSADLSVLKTVSDPTPNVGDTITFTVILTNAGTDDATNVTIDDLLPASLTFVGATPSQGSYDSVTGVWNVGTVTTPTPATLVIQAMVVGPTAQTNTATISASEQFDPNTSNNQSSATETPQRADLAVTKAVSDPRPNVGDTITFTVTLTNNGLDAATGVQLTDLLPAGLGFVGATPSQGTYDPAGGLWDVGNLADGASAVLMIQAQVNGPAAQLNRATVSAADQFDPNPGNNSAAALEVPQRADVAVFKTVDNPTPNVGDTIVFTITVANAGPDAATGVTVNDLLLPTLSIVSSSASQGTYNPTTGVWTVGTVADSASATLTITAQVVSAGSVVNSATGTGDQFDPNPGNNTDGTSVDPQQADLALLKSVSDATPNVGDQITFTVTLFNSGPNTATGVQVADLLPAGLSFVDAIPSQGTYTAGMWDVGTVAPSITPTLQLVATVVSPDSQTNTATISAADQFDPNTANNTASATETPQQSDLVVTKSVSDPQPNVGDQITFTVTLTNAGPDIATNVTLTDLLPAGLLFITATPSTGTYDSASGIWIVGTVAPGAPQTLTIQTRVDSPDARTNTGTISATDQFDPITANNTASASELPQQTDLALSKEVNNSRPNVGDLLVFTITLRNLGPNTATNVEVTDLLPAGLTFVSSTPSLGTYDPATGLWDVGTVGLTLQPTLVLRARMDSPDALTNVAIITAADQFDPDPVNNAASATETPQQADLAVTKTVNNANPNVGDVITFTVTLTNSGPDAATNVTVQDLVPAGLTFVNATPSQGSFDAGSGMWIVGTVASGANLTLVIQARVVNPASQTNVARVSGADQFDPNTGNNQGSITVTPALADLQVTKRANPRQVVVGQRVTFTITLRNLGPDAATNVVLTDRLPPGMVFVSARPTQGTYRPGTGRWNVGSLAAGGVATLRITVRVTAIGNIRNTARVSSPVFDPVLSNNAAVDAISVLGFSKRLLLRSSR